MLGRGRWVSLRPLTRRDVVDLHPLASQPDAVGRWPFDGRELSVEDLGAELWGTGRFHVALTRVDDGRLFGVVKTHDEDLRNGTAFLAAFVEPGLWSAGWPLEGVLLGIHHLFEVVDLRKLYICTRSSILPTLGNLGGLVVREAVRRDHFRTATGFDDIVYLSIGADVWRSSNIGAHLGRRAGTPEQGEAKHVPGATGGDGEHGVPRDGAHRNPVRHDHAGPGVAVAGPVGSDGHHAGVGGGDTRL